MQAIVLHRYNVRESDQIVTVFTKELGRQDVLARGVKKIVSKNAANLEPCAFVHLEMVQGREVSHLTKVQPIEYYSGIRKDPWKSMSAMYAMNLVRKVTRAGQTDVRLFESIQTWLRFLNTYSGTTYLSLVDAFVLQVFSELGFAPNTEECVVCSKPKHSMLKQQIEAGGKHIPGLYFAGGGLICADCKKTKRDLGEHIYDCGLKELSFFERMLDNDWRIVANMECTEKERKFVHALVYQYALYHYEYKLSDWGVWCP